MKIQLDTFKNGTQLGVATIPGQDEVAVGLWFRVGARHDPPGKSGLAHFHEHMVFMGTKTRTTREIARALEIHSPTNNNAETTYEATSYYAQVSKPYFPMVLDVLMDLILNPQFHPKRVEKEIGVVIRED